MPKGVYVHKSPSPESNAKRSMTLTGHTVSDETRAKRSVTMKERGHGGRTTGDFSWSDERRKAWSERQKGKPGRAHTEAAKLKMRVSSLGPLGSNWKGGVTDESKIARKSSEYRAWRHGVFARDGYKCRKGRSHSTHLQPHHILNFHAHPELRYDIENGVTLCVLCHKDFHRAFGKKRNTRLQIELFLSAMVETEQAEMGEVFMPYAIVRGKTMYDLFVTDNKQKKLGNGKVGRPHE